MSGLPHHIKFYELWHTVCACGILKKTQWLLPMSRDAVSQEHAHTGPITLQENLLTVVRTNLCARGTGFPQLHHTIRVDLVKQKNHVNLSLRDEGVPSQTKKILVDLSSCDEGRPFWNKKFLWICHQVMRVYPLEQKFLVDLSSCDVGGPYGNKKFLWICHQVIWVDPLEQKILVDLSSGNEGRLFGNKKLMRVDHRTKNLVVIT